ncbi:HD domain-containing protein [Chromohalobacter japonicus]|uniref:HD domain-containing protein n=1 Tax=Chromohalobacter japonicus TaxID=223900 RepID=UPI001FF5E5CD|nr:HD domain-containing protein [Chromohalobacter japonicus]MCK0753543.1 HD domain-containing protein [Chromohalobacter japonicus]
MIPRPQEDREILDYWVEDIKNDPELYAIIASKPFSRLNDISFLGALDYISPTLNLKTKKSARSRAHHSLYVAALANYIATQRNYSFDLKKHLIAAGLLHDIGHPPLSHSAEPYFKKQFGFGHHEMGEMLLNGELSSSKKLNKHLKKNFDFSFINSLLDKNIPNSEGGDLFSSPINIDTIEGITRTYKYISKASSSHDPLKYAHASFLSAETNAMESLDRFWRLKHFVYERLINSEIGISADKLSQIFFDDARIKINEKDVFNSERSWRGKYFSLFYKLKSISHRDAKPQELDGVPVEFYKRNYSINKSKTGPQRYEVSKKKCSYTFAETRGALDPYDTQKELGDGNLFV